LYKIRKSCSTEQSKILGFFDDLTPEKYHLLKEAKKNYSECIRKVKSDLLKNIEIAL